MGNRIFIYDFDREDCKFSICLNKTHTAGGLYCLLRSHQESEPVCPDTQVNVLTYLSYIMEAAVLKNILFDFQSDASRPSRNGTGKARVLIVI